MHHYRCTEQHQFEHYEGRISIKSQTKASVSSQIEFSLMGNYIN